MLARILAAAEVRVRQKKGKEEFRRARAFRQSEAEAISSAQNAFGII